MWFCLLGLEPALVTTAAVADRCWGVSISWWALGNHEPRETVWVVSDGKGDEKDLKR